MYAELKRKECKVCNMTKQINLFYKDVRRKDGLAYECKSCKELETRTRRKNNPELFIAKRRRSSLKEKFGITVEHYKMIHDAQKGLCAICHKPEYATYKKTGKIKPLSVDHDHFSNEIRGLLCGACNMTLGLQKDSIERLESAISYLKKFKN